MPLTITSFVKIWEKVRKTVGVATAVYSGTEFMVLKLQVSDASGTHAQDIILTSSYQKFSAVFGRMFVFYWVTDIGMRLLAAALADSQISSKKLHDH